MTRTRALAAALGILSAVPVAYTSFAAAPVASPESGSHRLVFATYAGGLAQCRKAEVLIESIRAFGGAHRNAPIYVVLGNLDSAPLADLRREGVHLLTLEMEPVARGWPFAEKVYAAAQVEGLVRGKAETLAWFDPETLVLKEPAALDLADGAEVAMRPVFLVNTIGIDPDRPVGGFWGAIYRQVGLEPDVAVPTVEAYVKGEPMRFYINCGIIAYRVEMGICREWARAVTAMLSDETFRRRHCADVLHRIFLHQAVLSAVILARTHAERWRWLPFDHGYPLGQQAELPPGRRAESLDDLACLIYDTLWDEHPQWMSLIGIGDPLRAWLQAAWDRTFRVTDRILREERSCNTYLVRTPEGDVVIDPGGASRADSRLLAIHRGRPLGAILLTHAHGDHRGGISVWKDGRDVPVIAQARHAATLADHDRIAGFLARRNAIIAGQAPPGITPPLPTPVEVTESFEERHRLTAGDLHIELLHAPGETPDTTTIWISELRAVWVADNFYTAFPNLSTLRGSRPRWALDYADALNTALALGPEVLLPGHDEPILGAEAVRRRLTVYRDAILHVHDAVVAGINAGTDVHTLMREITLPDELTLPQFFGRVSWAVRGIYEGYTGWFDGRPESMYDLGPREAYPELVALAGGAGIITNRARELLETGDPVRALQLTDAALSTDPANRTALQTRLDVLRTLRGTSRNYFERRFLDQEIRTIESTLATRPL